MQANCLFIKYPAIAKTARKYEIQHTKFYSVPSVSYIFLPEQIKNILNSRINISVQILCARRIGRIVCSS